MSVLNDHNGIKFSVTFFSRRPAKIEEFSAKLTAENTSGIYSQVLRENEQQKGKKNKKKKFALAKCEA